MLAVSIVNACVLCKGLGLEGVVGRVGCLSLFLSIHPPTDIFIHL